MKKWSSPVTSTAGSEGSWSASQRSYSDAGLPGSMTMTLRRLRSSPASATRPAYSFSTSSTDAPQWSITYAISRGTLRKLTGTCTKPPFAAAATASTGSTWLLVSVATRSPRRTPAAISPLACRLTRSLNCRYVRRRSPSTSASASGRRTAQRRIHSATVMRRLLAGASAPSPHAQCQRRLDGAAQDARLVLHRARERDAGKAARHLGQADLDLEPCERGAEAEVDAVPEGEVRVRIARDVEPLGIGELRGIAIRRCHQQHDAIAPLHGHSADHHVFGGGAHRALHGPVEAQALLDGGLQQLRLLAEAAPLARLQQRR